MKKLVFVFLFIILFWGSGCSKEVISNHMEESNDSVVEENIEQEIDTETVVSKGKKIVIDPGHQTKGDSSLEPIGPGASSSKAKVTTGATGVVTGQTESILNLKVSLLLKDILEKRGYEVIMTRVTNDINISNRERALIANREVADAFIRIHANSLDNTSVRGALTMCQTPSNPYNGNLSEDSCRLANDILFHIVEQTGFQNRGVTKTDTMSGINWSEVPVTIVEMGFLSNAIEDQLLATEEYQLKIAMGIADGIDEYFDVN